ncbi:DUF6924 domain-containing protein [Streptomyces sp. NBC_01497]|uniref:DUF6924 domain-containing protein n=1 Tax=Streptomyces sp. NBC_01497 TaxID=2903885 RepID=UPI002E37FE89|nr:hypothetical protein [Streptomyces sp. NBC_01497]
MSLPPTDDSTPLVRTDFSDEEAWRALLTAVTTPNEDDFLANLQIVDDPDHRDLTSEQVAGLAGPDLFLIVADRTALTAPGRPLLVLYRDEDESHELRVIAEELWSIENNISLANMDWDDFASSADEDGVFRGF